MEWVFRQMLILCSHTIIIIDTDITIDTERSMIGETNDTYGVYSLYSYSESSNNIGGNLRGTLSSKINSD